MHTEEDKLDRLHPVVKSIRKAPALKKAPIVKNELTPKIALKARKAPAVKKPEFHLAKFYEMMKTIDNLTKNKE